MYRQCLQSPSKISWTMISFQGSAVLISSLVLCAFCNFVSTWNEENNHFLNNNDEMGVESRNPKFFPFFLGPSVVRIANTECTGENGLVGTCYGRNECSGAGGKTSGSCANGFGRCCIMQKTCGMHAKTNCTYFASPGYPAPYLGGDMCTVTVWPCGASVCQLRLDFIDFTLAPPDGDGVCNDDFFMVSGAGSNVPRICGINTGEHVYVDFNGNSPIMLTVDTNKVLLADRKWLIKITQIKCCNRAPVGCLMNYKGTSGVVKSFNYSPTLPGAPTLGGIGSRELANLNYGVCVEMTPGYCSIEWSQNPADPNSFTVSGDNAIAPGFAEVNCTSDFIVIPNPMQNGISLPYDRFCGTALPNITTSSKPFVLTVVTDGTEATDPAMTDVDNRGFCLNYRQLPCAT